MKIQILCAYIFIKSAFGPIPGINSPVSIGIYWVQRGTLRVKCLAHAQEHNALPRPRVESRLLNPGSCALTISLQCLTRDSKVATKM